MKFAARPRTTPRFYAIFKIDASINPLLPDTKDAPKPATLQLFIRSVGEDLEGLKVGTAVEGTLYALPPVAVGAYLVPRNPDHGEQHVPVDKVIDYLTTHLGTDTDQENGAVGQLVNLRIDEGLDLDDVKRAFSGFHIALMQRELATVDVDRGILEGHRFLIQPPEAYRLITADQNLVDRQKERARTLKIAATGINLGVNLAE